MGLFGSSSTPSTPKTSVDGTPEAPDRTARAKCWEGRDAFFKCLDRNGIIDSIKDEDKASKLCGNEGKLFEKDCASSWVGRLGILHRLPRLAMSLPPVRMLNHSIGSLL